MTDISDLRVPPTEAEISALNPSSQIGKVELTNKGWDVIRRLAFQRDILQSELRAVMHSVDKWFDDDDERLKDNPATRSAVAREIALKEIDRLVTLVGRYKQFMRPFQDDDDGVSYELD